MVLWRHQARASVCDFVRDEVRDVWSVELLVIVRGNKCRRTELRRCNCSSLNRCAVAYSRISQRPNTTTWSDAVVFCFGFRHRDFCRHHRALINCSISQHTIIILTGCVECQVTLCDPIRQVTLRSCEMGFP